MTLELIAQTLEDEAAKLRELAATFKADESKLVADLDSFGTQPAGTTTVTTSTDTTTTAPPVVEEPSPVTLATPTEPAPQEPQPAEVTNVHASDLPLPSEQPQETVSEEPPAA